MLKYVDTKVVFRELPDEITLAINLSGCPCHCKSCHSPYLADNIGTKLSSAQLDILVAINIGITAICLMGGDASPKEVEQLAKHIKSEYSKLKVGWYSGRDVLPNDIDLTAFDYVKIGHYDERYGALNKKTTNQRVYKVKKGATNAELEDVTSWFYEHQYIS